MADYDVVIQEDQGVVVEITQGLQGPKGDKGDVGPTGPRGLAGPSGAKGDTGVSGSQGIEGPQGPVGNTGATGPAGPRGDTGSKGDIGPQGPQGVQGAKGDTGERGLIGPKGDTGLQGIQGVKGDTGTTGTKGDKGDTGLQGIQGVKGDKGDTGDVGPLGPQGPSGASVPLSQAYVWSDDCDWYFYKENNDTVPEAYTANGMYAYNGYQFQYAPTDPYNTIGMFNIASHNSVNGGIAYMYPPTSMKWFQQTGFTVIQRVKVDTLNANQTLRCGIFDGFAGGAPAGAGFEFVYEANNNHVVCRYNDAGSNVGMYETTYEPVGGIWMTFKLVYDKASHQIQYYIDGTLVYSRAFGELAYPIAGPVIANISASGTTRCSIDYVQVSITVIR